MTAVLDAYRSGLFHRKHWASNLISGIIVGVVALPLGMAFAIASGVKPEQGLYTAIVAGLVVSLFGGSRVQIAGPTGAFIVVLSGVTARHGVDGLQIATLMAGCFLLLFGIGRLGAAIKFIPDPVIVGFTSGIAVVIWVGQWKAFFGLPVTAEGHFHEKFWALLLGMPQCHLASTLIGLGSLAVLLICSRLSFLKQVPGPLVALVLATLFQSVFQWEGVVTIGSAFGGIPEGLPTFRFPDLRLDRILELIGPAFTIAMLGAIESLLSAVVADGMAGTRHHSNQELIGQGLANILTPLFGGFAATGAIARTATNIRNGGTSPLAGVVHSLTLILVLLFFAPLADNVPLSTLAAILFLVCWNMAEVHHFARMVRRAPMADLVILWVTFGLTVFADLVVAVNIGVMLAMLHFLRRMATSVEVSIMNEQVLQAQALGQGVDLPPGVLAYRVEGPFFYGAVETFERAFEQTIEAQTLIIRLGWVPFIDITGLQTLEEIILLHQRRGVRVILTGANERVNQKLDKAGILELIGRNNNFSTFDAALAHLGAGVAGAAVI